MDSHSKVIVHTLLLYSPSKAILKQPYIDYPKAITSTLLKQLYIDSPKANRTSTLLKQSYIDSPSKAVVHNAIVCLLVSRKLQSMQDQLFTVISGLSVAEVATLKSSKNALYY